MYAAGLGTEYIYPVYDVGHHGYKSSLKALCWLYCCMGCLFSCGIGQIFSLCGKCFVFIVVLSTCLFSSL